MLQKQNTDRKDVKTKKIFLQLFVQFWHPASVWYYVTYRFMSHIDMNKESISLYGGMVVDKLNFTKSTIRHLFLSFLAFLISEDIEMQNLLLQMWHIRFNLRMTGWLPRKIRLFGAVLRLIYLYLILMQKNFLNIGIRHFHHMPVQEVILAQCVLLCRSFRNIWAKN